MRNTTEEDDVVAVEDVVVAITVSVATEVVEERGQMMKRTMKREDKRANKIGVDEAVVVEEAVAQIVQMSNVTIAENMDTMQRTATLRRRWKKTRI